MTKGRAVVVGAVVLMLLVTAVIIWHLQWRSVSIQDVTKSTDINLQARRADSWPMSWVSTVEIWITGQLDGEADIWAEGWDRQTLSGTVDYRVGHDWFNQVCQIHYEPRGVTSGTLRVRYTFR